MMKAIFPGLGLVLAIAPVQIGAAAAETLRIATEGNYAPFNFVDDSGKLAGFDVNVGNALCERMGVECVWVKNDWDSIIPNLVSGNYDAIMAGMSVTDERKEAIAFSEAYYPAPFSVFVALSEDADLGDVVTAQAGTIQANYVAESGATLLEFPTIDETVAAVRNGEAEATLGDLGSLGPIVEGSNDLVIVGEGLRLADGIGIGLRKSDTELRERFDRTLQEMKEDGSLDQLIHDVFGADAEGFQP